MIASALSAYEQQQQQHQQQQEPHDCEGLPNNDLYEDPAYYRNSYNGLRKQRKSVSFAATAKVRWTICIDEYSERERRATWYSRQELKLIHDENRYLVDLLMLGERIVEEQNSIRGLEAFTPEIRSKKQYNRAVALDAVLNEQYYQQSVNMNDAEQLAIEYSTVTYDCQVAAGMVGISDEVAAMPYKNYKRSSSSSSSKKKTRTSMSRLHHDHHHHHQPSSCRIAVFGNMQYPRSL